MTLSKAAFPCLSCRGRGMLRAGRLVVYRNRYVPCNTCQSAASRQLLEARPKGAPKEMVREMLDPPIPQRYVVIKKSGIRIVFDRKEDRPVADLPGGSDAIQLTQILNRRAAAEEASREA